MKYGVEIRSQLAGRSFGTKEMTRTPYKHRRGRVNILPEQRQSVFPTLRKVPSHLHSQLHKYYVHVAPVALVNGDGASQ